MSYDTHNHSFAKQLMVLMAIMTLFMNYFKVNDPIQPAMRNSGGGVNLRRLADSQMAQDEDKRMHEK